MRQRIRWPWMLRIMGYLLVARPPTTMADEIRNSMETSPPRRRVVPPWVKYLVIADVVILAVIVAVYVAMRGTDDRENVANEGLRGSKPPAGQRIPDLSKITGMSPAMPSPSELRGDVTLYVATCMECPSGDIVAGALRRLGERDLPDGTRLEAVVWEGDADAWRSEWNISDDVPLHVVTGADSVALVKRALNIGDNGFAYLYDAEGVWRSSFAVQLMQRDDIVHDMEELAD